MIQNQDDPNRLPLVWALVLNWNGKQITIECVASLLESDYSSLRVAVIDNGSSDGSPRALRERFAGRITVLQNQRNLGYARGFNVGLQFGFEKNAADYCLVMNNDTVIDPGAVSELVRVARTDEQIGFVTGKVYYYDRPNILQTVGRREDPVKWNGGKIGEREEDRGQYNEIRQLPFADDIYSLVSRKLYLEIGGYNPLFFLQGEEYDWQARARKAGYKIVYTPGARLWHRESWTLGKTSARKAYFDARNPMLVVLLHQPAGYFKRYFWAHVKKEIFKGSLVAVKQLRLSVALAKWRGFFSGVWWGVRNGRFSWQHFC